MTSDSEARLLHRISSSSTSAAGSAADNGVVEWSEPAGDETVLSRVRFIFGGE